MYIYIYIYTYAFFFLVQFTARLTHHRSFWGWELQTNLHAGRAWHQVHHCSAEVATTVSETRCALHAPSISDFKNHWTLPSSSRILFPYLIRNHWTLPVSLPKEVVLPTPLPGRSDSSRTSAHTQYNAVYTDHHSRIQAACGPLPDTQVHKGYQFGGHSPHMADTMCSLIQNTSSAW